MLSIFQLILADDALISVPHYRYKSSARRSNKTDPNISLASHTQCFKPMGCLHELQCKATTEAIAAVDLTS